MGSTNTLALAPLAALIFSACGGDQAGTSPDTSGWSSTFDFVTEHGRAERWSEIEVLQPGLLDSRKYLTAGWSFPADVLLGVQEEAEQPLWVDAREAEITLCLREVAPRSLRLALAIPSVVPKDESQEARFTWNGIPIGAAVIGHSPEILVLDVPASAQVAGTNHLGFELARTWRLRDIDPHLTDHRTLSVSLRSLSLTSTDGAVARRSWQAHELLPEGSRVPAGGSHAQRSIEQVSGSVLRYYLRVPPASILESSVVLGQVGGDARGRFRIRVAADDGEEWTLVEQTLAAGEVGKLHVPLEPLAGQIVRLDFEVEAADWTGDPIVGTWIAPRLCAPVAAGGAPATEVAGAPVKTRQALRGAPVVCMLLDACGARYLSTYGGRPGLTPNLDRLAAEGTRFDMAYSGASYTIASVATMLTSRPTWEHATWCEGMALAEDLRTWPESFLAAGWRTVGIFHSPNGGSPFRFDRGFERRYEVFRSVWERRGKAIAADALPPLEETLASKDPRSLFLWMHIIEPHEPYTPPAPWGGSLSGGIESSLPGDTDTLCAIRSGDIDPTADDLAKLRANYEENLAYVDAQVGEFLERLETSGLLERAVVAVFADHGEGFMEHDGKIFGGMSHGSTVYDEMSRIPLIIRLPPGLAPEGRVSHSPVTSMDLLNTLGDLVGVQPPQDSRGRSFAGLLFDPTLEARENLVMHTSSMMNDDLFLPTFGLVRDGWKYVHTSGNRAELYHLAEDPGEVRNQIVERPILAGFLRAELARETEIDPDIGVVSLASSAVELDDATLESMKALGYVR